VHILIDLVILTYIVHLTGGIENPIYLFYIFHVVLSSILLPRWLPYIIATMVVILFSVLVYTEHIGLIYHYSIFESASHQNEVLMYLTLIIFTITVYFSSYICTNFMHIFRDSKRHIDHLYEQLRKADQQKTQFFQYASHELKAPIIAIKSSIDSVLSNFTRSLEERPLNVLKRASARAEQMLNIIRELLDLTRNRALIQNNNLENVAIINVLKDVIRNETATAEMNNIQIQEQLDVYDAIITGKTDDFRKIFSNLIGNAVRYNKPGGNVRIKSFKNNNFLHIEISDTGIGIAVEDQSNIFAEFFRAENARKQVNFGTGLGLSIVKQIVQNYQGTISVESELNMGTTFKLVFPLMIDSKTART
jgi:signal transduction histidine kinase